MSTAKRKSRTCFSLKAELLEKSRESAISAVQIFNTPTLKFRAETFIVLMIIAWTYLFHAYYRENNIEYRRREEGKRRGRRVYKRTHNNAFVYWGLEECLEAKECPVDNATKQNLRFMIGLRNEVEHQMCLRIEEIFGARFHACCLNYNEYIKKLFGKKYGIDSLLSFAIQFTSISEAQKNDLANYDFPTSVIKFINDFDESLSDDEFNDPHFSHRLLFVKKTVNAKGKADRVIEFVNSDDELSEAINNHERDKIYLKEIEKKKYYVKDIVKLMHELGYTKFNTYHHTTLWQEKDGKNLKYGYGVSIHDIWYWYEPWVDIVKKHCEENKEKYMEIADNPKE